MMTKSAVLLAGAALATAACHDAPTRPVGADEAPAAASGEGMLAISAERVEIIGAALADTRTRSLRSAIERADARGELNDLLERLAARVVARDGAGIRRALLASRAAIVRYRNTVEEGSGLLPEIEVISLTLDRIEAAATTENTTSDATVAIRPKSKEN